MDPSLFQELHCVFQKAGWRYDGLATNVGNGAARACWSAYGWVAEVAGEKVRILRHDSREIRKELSTAEPDLQGELTKIALE